MKLSPRWLGRRWDDGSRPVARRTARENAHRFRGVAGSEAPRRFRFWRARFHPRPNPSRTRRQEYHAFQPANGGRLTRNEDVDGVRVEPSPPGLPSHRRQTVQDVVAPRNRVRFSAKAAPETKKAARRLPLKGLNPNGLQNYFLGKRNSWSLPIEVAASRIWSRIRPEVVCWTEPSPRRVLPAC